MGAPHEAGYTRTLYLTVGYYRFHRLHTWGGGKKRVGFLEPAYVILLFRSGEHPAVFSRIIEDLASLPDSIVGLEILDYTSPVVIIASHNLTCEIFGNLGALGVEVMLEVVGKQFRQRVDLSLCGVVHIPFRLGGLAPASPSPRRPCHTGISPDRCWP